MSFIVSCCSTADLTEEVLLKRDIHYVCFHFQIDGKDLPDDLGKSMDFKAFYDAMRNGADTHTSQVSVGEYEEYFEPFLKEGKDILHLTLSSGISGTYQSAVIARDAMQAKYPERKIIVIDSLDASSGYGLLMMKLADMRDNGATIDEAAAWANEYRLHVHHWFFTDDLTYLIRGGRVSKASGMIGKLLNICPMLNVDCNGKLANRAKIRSKRKAMAGLVDRMVENADNGEAYSDQVCISHADCYEDAVELSHMVEERFPATTGKHLITTIGTTIGSHTGPGLLLLSFMGQKRVD